ncbi:MAG: SGNH/GDSL hydrolase family protein [Verrucomicrobiales bacterium]
MKLRSTVSALALLFLLSAAVPAVLRADTEPTNAEEAAAKEKAELAEVEAEYQAWVATLTPEHRAWEKVLQENLGNFYLPIHQRDKIRGRANAWDFVVDDPALPRVLLIGDSVSRGYTMAARKALAGKANVHRAPANCGPTKLGLERLDVWLGDGNWDLIHFNFGIHDRATPLSEYEERLGKIVDRLAATGATLVWANTTPIPDFPDKKLTAASIVERNEVAAKLMEGKGIAINDLFSSVTPRLAELQNSDDVHFNAEGYRFLGERVAASIEGNLE